MKFGNIPVVVAILVATFVIALTATQLLSGNTNILSSIPVLGSLGLNPSVPITLTQNFNEIFVNKSITLNAAGNFNQIVTITASVPPVNNKCASNTIQFFSDIGTLSPATCSASGSTRCLATQCPFTSGCHCVEYSYNNPPCACSVKFSSAVPGVATIVAQSSTNPGTYINGQATVTVDWPTPCFGTAKNCSTLTTQTNCNAQGGCNWYGSAGCYGTNAVQCAGLDTTTCSHTFGCQPVQGGGCAGAPCSTWTKDPKTCNAAGCNYTATACGGTATSCNSITDKLTCSAENGCAWVGNNPTSPTTSTTTLAATTTTTTTTTTPANPAFSASNFKCSPLTRTFNCSFSYYNGLGENVEIVFITSDSSGNSISSVVYTTSPGAGIAQTNYFCTNQANYYMSWEAYRASDTNFQHAVGFSDPPGLLMSC